MDKKAKMDALLREAYEKGGFNGTWLFAEKGEIVSKGALGFRDAADTLPMEEDCVFDLASVTKQFTATAVMLLRRRGLLNLDDEVTKFFPALPFPGVTVRHLLHHTGGLPDYMDWVDKTARAEGCIPGNDVILRFLCESGQPADFAPGEKWEYSNTGYCLLAQIVEVVAGVPFEDFLRDNIFEPAGMHATRVYHRRKDKLTIDKLAYGLVLPLGGERYVLPDDTVTDDDVVPLDGVNGDGLVHSNILDLYTWDRALRAGKVLTKEEQALMTAPGRLNSGELAIEEDEGVEYGYGFGWDILNDPEHGLIVCHSGGWPGYSLWYERWIDADKVLIRLRCRDPRDEWVAGDLVRGMKAILEGREPEPIRTVEERAIQEPDRSGWDALCGRYDFGDAAFRIDEILRKGDTLYAKASYKGNTYELKLYPLGEKRFGVKDLSGEFLFTDEGLTLWGETHKKLEGEQA